MIHKILLIDDDRDDREFFMDAVSKVSSTVSCIALESCVDLIADLNSGKLQRPNLIFLDINMPEMNGWTCLSHLKKEADLAEIPVIMYSTSQYSEEGIKAKTAGALSFFSKPYDFRELQDILKKVIQHLDQNSLENLNQNSNRFH